jgi:hypothetical protein
MISDLIAIIKSNGNFIITRDNLLDKIALNPYAKLLLHNAGIVCDDDDDYIIDRFADTYNLIIAENNDTLYISPFTES